MQKGWLLKNGEWRSLIMLSHARDVLGFLVIEKIDFAFRVLDLHSSVITFDSEHKIAAQLGIRVCSHSNFYSGLSCYLSEF